MSYVYASNILASYVDSASALGRYLYVCNILASYVDSASVLVSYMYAPSTLTNYVDHACVVVSYVYAPNILTSYVDFANVLGGYVDPASILTSYVDSMSYVSVSVMSVRYASTPVIGALSFSTDCFMMQSNYALVLKLDPESSGHPRRPRAQRCHELRPQAHAVGSRYS